VGGSVTGGREPACQLGRLSGPGAVRRPREAVSGSERRASSPQGCSGRHRTAPGRVGEPTVRGSVTGGREPACQLGRLLVLVGSGSHNMRGFPASAEARSPKPRTGRQRGGPQQIAAAVACGPGELGCTGGLEQADHRSRIFHSHLAGQLTVAVNPTCADTCSWRIGGGSFGHAASGTSWTAWGVCSCVRLASTRRASVSISWANSVTASSAPSSPQPAT
jgi:hypothetical protein